MPPTGIASKSDLTLRRPGCNAGAVALLPPEYD